MTTRPVAAILLALVLTIAPAACADGDPDADAAAEPPRTEEMTRRQRDSAIAESRLPGAQGVRGALDASDAAAARAAALDSAGVRR